ncbi:MAG: C1 family peptidase [Desulfobacterales bacterium]
MPRKKAAKGKRSSGAEATSHPTPQIDGYQLTARPDLIDFRDRMYEPTLVEVPSHRPLKAYQEHGNPVLDQRKEGACTGFGLAAVANYLLRTRRVVPDDIRVSPRMLYEMAKRYDEWEGEDYAGSSARGAMKGWHKHGVCSEDKWPYRSGKADRRFTRERIDDARYRPLGAYFRVNHKDIVSLHSALSEVGILYATAYVHHGWSGITSSGIIEPSERIIGCHAFAIVGYDEKGFWIQNSWGEGWGKSGFGRLGYDDWLKNGTDVWVGRLGVPVIIDSAVAVASDHFAASQTSQSASFSDLRSHIVSLGRDGMPDEMGGFGNTPGEIRQIIRKDLPRLTEKWRKKRLLLYANGGLVGEKPAIQRVAEYRQVMLEAEVYPISFAWHGDFWSTLRFILREALEQRKSQGPVDDSKDFMLDRLDHTLEPLARFISGKGHWDAMKEKALKATANRRGGARLVAAELKKLLTEHEIEIHVAGHSAGAIFMAPLVGAIARFAPIKTCTLWAPACTMVLFRKHYLPLLKGSDRRIRKFALYTLTDQAEQDDHCANIYNKSLLYLVSQAFEDEFNALDPGWPGVPLLGMEKFVKNDADLKRLFETDAADWVISPNTSEDPCKSAGSATHGGFEDDPAIVRGTLSRILGDRAAVEPDFAFARSASSLQDRRRTLNRITD